MATILSMRVGANACCLVRNLISSGPDQQVFKSGDMGNGQYIDCSWQV
ncbi:MAG: hypothetical protein QNJ48_04790 [Desulfobacterales bacterium]|nr:hypothetical protein [Desulfobacterales bacterium]